MKILSLILLISAFASPVFAADKWITYSCSTGGTFTTDSGGPFEGDAHPYKKFFRECAGYVTRAGIAVSADGSIKRPNPRMYQQYRSVGAPVRAVEK